MGRFSGRYPDINVNESEKDEQWHKDFILGIINDAIDGRYEFTYTSMQESYDFYDGTHSVDEYAFLQESENGDTLPAIWINYNKIRNRVNSLIGELNQKGFGFRVRAENKEAVSERLEKKLEMLAANDIRQDLQQLQAISGLPTAPTENIPTTEEEIEDFINNKYKDKSERVMEAALRWLVKKYEWQELRLQLFRDLVIAGRSFVKTEIEEGLPKWRRVDPRYMVFDSYAKDDFLRESSYFGEIRYMPLSEAIQLFDLTKEEVEKIKHGNLEEGNRISSNRVPSYEINGETNLEFLTHSDSTLKVLVFYGEWMDNQKLKRKKSVDKFGNEHFKKVKANAKGKDIVTKNIKSWRKGTLIGGQIMRDWGLRENMIRSIDDIYDTKPSYVSLAHNWVNHRTISTVDLLKGLQKFKDIALYNMQLAMNRAGTKGFMYDISQIPEGWNLEEVLYHLKTSGIGVYNSKKDGITSPGKSFDEFDMTLSNSISQYINFSQMIDREMDEITGINPERQGQVTAASQAVGVTQAAIASSQTSTEPMFEAFRKFSENVLRSTAGLAKIAFGEDKEVFSPIIGDAGVDFIREDVDMHLQDYGVFIEMTPPLIGDQAKLEQLMTAALQAGKIEVEDALDLIRDMSGDIDVAILRLKKAIKRREDERQQREQQMMMQQQQAAAQAEQASRQQEFQMKQMQASVDAQRQQQNSQQGHQNRMRETILKERLKSENQI